MVQSEVIFLTEPEEFAAAVRGADVELSVLTPGTFTASITRVMLGSLKMMRVSESHPRIMHSTVRDDRAIFSFRTDDGAGMFRNGIEMPPGAIARLARRQSYFQRSVGPVRWSNMSLAVEDLQTAGSTATGCDLTPPRSEVFAIPVPAAMATLQRLNTAAGLIAESAPEVIDVPEAARGMEQALVGALVSCFSADDGGEDKSAQRRHRAIMRRFHAALEAEAERPFYVLEMAEAVGVLPGASGDGTQEVPAAAAYASGEAGVIRGRPEYDDRHRRGHAIWLLAIGPFLSRIQTPVR
jgi:hypothetical protein